MTTVESANADDFSGVFKRDGDTGADSAAPAVDGAARDDKGRFAPKPEAEIAPEAKAAEVQPKPETASPTDDRDNRRHVPLRELHAERDRRRDERERLLAEHAQRIKDYDAKFAALEQRFQAPPPQQVQPQSIEPPDPLIDPQGAFRYQQQQMQSALANMNANNSERYWRDKAGNEAVDAALKAAPQEVAQHCLRTQDPYGELIRWHKSTSFLAKVGPDPDAWQKTFEADMEKKVREKVLAELKAGKGVQSFPGSLATATQAGVQGEHISEEAIAKDIFGSGRNRRAG